MGGGVGGRDCAKRLAWKVSEAESIVNVWDVLLLHLLAQHRPCACCINPFYSHHYMAQDVNSGAVDDG